MNTHHGLLVVIAAALLGGALLQLWLAWAGYRDNRSKQPERRPTVADRELQQLTETLSATRQRLAGIERQLSQLQNVQERPSPQLSVEPAYEIAQNMARKGADIDELIGTCGLARAEAELMTRLYQRGPTAPKATSAPNPRRHTGYVA